VEAENGGLLGRILENRASSFRARPQLGGQVAICTLHCLYGLNSDFNAAVSSQYTHSVLAETTAKKDENIYPLTSLRRDKDWVLLRVLAMRLKDTYLFSYIHLSS
jgi:hypothetical protein